MERIKLDLGRMTILEKIELGKTINSRMTTNPNFPTPDPPLTDLVTKDTDLETIYNSVLLIRSEAKQKTVELNQKADALDREIIKLANYVENHSDGDAAKIESAGFKLASTGHPIGNLKAPEDLAVTTGDNAGELDCHWNPVTGAKSYVVQTNIVDPLAEVSWKDTLTPTKSKCELNNLTSGTRYWIRVAAVGAAGRSGWSDVATKIAP